MKPIPNKTEHGLEDELLQLLAKQVRRLPIPIILSAAIIAGFASNYVPTIFWSSWLALVCIILLVRGYILQKLPNNPNLSSRQALKIVIYLNALHGIAYGVSAGFFLYLPELERSIQTILLMGLCTGAVSTSAGYRPIFAAYAIPVVCSLSLMWSLSSIGKGVQVPEIFASLFILLYGLVLLGLAKDAFRLFKDSFEIRLQQIELNNKLKDALELAESANRSKTRFLASASHDLRQPIHTLSLFGAALDTQPLNAKSREIIQFMNTAIQALATQLNSLLDISKLDANIIEVNSSPVDVRDLLRRISQEMRTLATAKNLKYELNCTKKYIAYTDELLLERIFRNLISNAIKYTESGEILIQVKSQNDKLLIEISDSGCGIDIAEHSRIYEEFYQISNPERDRSKGLGLGLSIVKRLSKMLDIELSLDSKLNNGTTFGLLIPLLVADSSSQTKELLNNSAWEAYTVLVVDDEASVREGMKALLDSLGCKTLLAESTETALELSKKTVPDIVLADFRLRGNETGIQTIKALRNTISNLPAVLISGDTAPDRLLEAKEAGISLLHKPVMANDLKNSIAEACHNYQEK